MERTDQSRMLSAGAAAVFDRSMKLLATRSVVLIRINGIPDDLLRTWIVPDPLGLLAGIADLTADPDSTLPYAVYTRAYALHDCAFSRMRGQRFLTPGSIVAGGFLSYQELLRIAARLRDRRIAVPPFLPFNFVGYPDTLPAVRAYARKYNCDVDLPSGG